MISLIEYLKNRRFPYTNIKATFHNHNYLCGHASGTVRDYCERALSKGLDGIGISDHGYVGVVKDRMSKEDFYERYLPQFNEVSDFDIKVYKGLEVEYFSHNIDLYKEYLKHVDYLILGQHHYYFDGELINNRFVIPDQKMSKAYEKTCIDALGTGLFKILAHPEIAFYNMEKLTDYAIETLENIVSFCTKNNIIMEVNVNGLRHIKNGVVRYPRQELLDLYYKYQTPVIVSDDAHNISEIKDEYTIGVYSYLLENGFNVVDSI